MAALTSGCTDAATRIDPEAELRSALQDGRLHLHFQPIVALSSGRIRGVEALVRWVLPDGTVLMPDDFLPAVAHTDAVHGLTDYVIDRACAQAAAWPAWTMSVNIAARDAVRGSLVDVVAGALARHAVQAQRLTLELTEHAAVQGLAAATEVLQRLRALGVGIALDDFGTGYSSLLYLRDLPVTEVKIDRTFVSGVERLDDDAAIVHSVVQLAEAVGMAVVAEGVETAGQARYLSEVGCAFAQGFRFARPGPADAIPLALNQTLFEAYPSARPPRRPAGRSEPPAAALTRIADLTAAGASLHTIAAALNRDGLQTKTGTRWTAAAVAHALRDGSPAAG